MSLFHPTLEEREFYNAISYSFILNTKTAVKIFLFSEIRALIEIYPKIGL